MLTRITLQNIRLFEGPEWSFPLKRLTLFCGTNSAGKSTLLKLPLLLKQSQEVSYATGGRLRMAGPYADLGAFHSLVSNNDVTRELGLSVAVPVKLRPSQLRAVGHKLLLKDEQGRARRVDCSVVATFLFHGEHDDAQAAGDKTEPPSPPSRAALETAHFTLSIEDAKTPTFSWYVKRVRPAEGVRAPYEIAIPKTYLDRVAGDWLKPLRVDDGMCAFAVLLDGLLPSALEADVRGKGDALSKRQRVPIPPLLFDAVAAIEEALEGLRYLGPIRAPPRRYYISQDTDYDIDTSGEGLPLLLGEAARREVDVIDPSGVRGVRPLMEAINLWLWFIRTGDRSATGVSELVLPRTKDVVEFRLRAGEAGSHALADSGFGYSQVLPVLVQGLLSKTGETLLVEQPELHLNPALQVRLAEFFTGLVRSGRQVVLETHSEHMVNAFRVAIAEDASGQLSDSTALIYVGEGPRGPAVSSLTVTPNGTVPEWPEDFMGEAAHLVGRLLRAQRRFGRPQD